jgi:predicted choloylglycine hydrolase
MIEPTYEVGRETSVKRVRLDAVCAGSPHDIGAAQGQAVSDRIWGARRALARLEAFRLEQPRWMPYLLFRRLAERKADRLLASALRRDYPEMAERLSGLVVGAAMGAAAVRLFHALEPMLSNVRGRVVMPCPGACSAVAVAAGRSATGEPMIHKNFDYLPLVQPFYTLRDCRPTGRMRSLDFTVAPLVGAIDGINEAGLCITYNYAFTLDAAAPTGTISMAISESLERCSTVAEAAEWITSRPRWGGGLLMLADAGGDIASLELSSTRARLRRPADGAQVVSHTNAFSTAAMHEVEVPHDAVFTNAAPTPLRGRRVHESAETRDCRLVDLLGNAGRLSPDDLAAIMADHGPSGVPGNYTPCVHGDYWNTTACLQFFPRSRRMRVAYDYACRAQYQEFGL